MRVAAVAKTPDREAGWSKPAQILAKIGGIRLACA